MNIKVTTLFSMALAGGLLSVSAGDIKGKITLKGTPPPGPVLPLDPSCGKLHPAGSKPTMPFYVVAKDGGLADVFVTLEGVPANSTGPSAKPAVIDQKGCEYHPYVLGAQTGQTITVKNSDPLLHNVHPTPKPGSKNKEANKAQLPNGPDLNFTFESPEEFLRFKCDVHPWMFAYVNVSPHPYFAVSEEGGSFTIANVPPGKYKIKAKHRKAGEVIQDIEVTDSGATINFELAVQ